MCERCDEDVALLKSAGLRLTKAGVRGFTAHGRGRVTWVMGYSKEGPWHWLLTICPLTKRLLKFTFSERAREPMEASEGEPSAPDAVQLDLFTR